MEIQKVLKNNEPARLVGSGRRASFVLRKHGKVSSIKLRGITKRLQSKIYSKGLLPMIARRAEPRTGGCWRGKNGGRRRGRAVDRQLSKVINNPTKNDETLLDLVKSAMVALEVAGLEPIVAQRPVASEKHGLATAVDVIARRESTLVLVELKCGFDHGRTAPAVKNGKDCYMKEPVSEAPDHTLNRHCAQLAATLAMFKREKATIAELKKCGITRVTGMLLYATDAGTDLYKIPSWWCKRGAKLLSALK